MLASKTRRQANHHQPCCTPWPKPWKSSSFIPRSCRTQKHCASYVPCPCRRHIVRFPRISRLYRRPIFCAYCGLTHARRRRRGGAGTFLASRSKYIVPNTCGLHSEAKSQPRIHDMPVQESIQVLRALYIILVSAHFHPHRRANSGFLGPGHSSSPSCNAVQDAGEKTIAAKEKKNPHY